MRTEIFNMEEIFNNYADNMDKIGALTREAKYSIPSFVLDVVPGAEIDLSDDLRKIAAKGAAQMYDLISDDVCGDAHKGGDVEIVSAKDGLGVVETVESAHAKIKEMATKKMKLARVVADMAYKLDVVGHRKYAQELDAALAEFLGQESMSETKSDFDELLDQLQGLVLETMAARTILVDHYRDQLLRSINGVRTSRGAAAVSELSKQFYKFLSHLYKTENKPTGEAMYKVYGDFMEISRLAKESLNPVATSAELPAPPATPAPATPQE